MRFKINEGNAEIMLDSNEREILRNVDKELASINIRDLDEIIWKNIYGGNEKSKYHIYYNIGISLNVMLSSNATNYLLFIITLPQVVEILSNKLKEEGIFSEKSVKLFLELSAKYGAKLISIKESILKPKDWIRIDSNLLISQEVIKLHSIMWRFDGTSIEFDAPLDSIVILVDHFIKKTLAAIKRLNKESVLEIDPMQIEMLEKDVQELKELRASIESEIEPSTQ
ncbi:MAG: hypothetical protein A4E45_00064 [Methanosaeta sp. PtaB.Bin039]|nr:MAG: hypothetical protein A4E45_00064 [Methanosaeta sp. PtaB.Bin039]